MADNMRMHYLPPTHLAQWRMRHWQTFQNKTGWNKDRRHNTMAHFHAAWQCIHWSALRKWGFWSSRSRRAKELNVSSRNWVFAFNHSGKFKGASSSFSLSRESLSSLGKWILELNRKSSGHMKAASAYCLLAGAKLELMLSGVWKWSTDAELSLDTGGSWRSVI